MTVDSKISFEKINEIGSLEGKNSKVFLAKDIQLDAELVIKEIPKTSFSNAHLYYAEARNLYSSKHPNIVEIHYASEDDDNIYFALPYYQKGSLNSIMANRFLSVREILKYSLEFLTALHYIHTKKLVHFDIKPTNILINDSNVALLTDFGLSKYLDGFGLASPEGLYHSHVPPEALTGTDIDLKTDIYQSGLTIYRMCNGNEPFHKHWRKRLQTKEERMEAITNGTFPDRSYFLPHIPKQLRKVILKAIETDHSKRYNSVLEMINELSKIDKSLDWIYSKNNKNTHVWEIHESNSVSTIILDCQKGIWSTRATKHTISSNNTTNISAWTVDKFPDINKAFLTIESWIIAYKC